MDENSLEYYLAPERVSLAEGRRLERLERLMREKRVGSKLLLYGRADAPVNPPMIENWLHGRIKTTERGQLFYVFKALRDCTPRVSLADNHRLERLERMMHEKGVGSFTLMKGRDDAPVKHHLIESWLRGLAKTAEREKLAYVFNALRQLPPKPEQPRIRQPKVRLDENHRFERFERMMREKYVSSGALLAGQNDASVTQSILNHWLSGHVVTAERTALARVFRMLRHYEPSERRVRLDENHRLERLNKLMWEKNIGSKKLLRGRDDAPVTRDQIDNWRDGSVVTSERTALAWVFNALRHYESRASHVPLKRAVRYESAKLEQARPFYSYENTFVAALEPRLTPENL